jgi:hypothetical protein
MHCYICSKCRVITRYKSKGDAVREELERL